MEAKTVEEAAVMMHEVFLSMLEAGFTEAQALQFLAYWTRPDQSDQS